jgi:hypothetical protein
MITLKPDAKINIMMPHQNKAFNVVLSLATPVQLEQLKEGKDLKSVVSSLFFGVRDNYYFYDETLDT